MEWIEVDPVNGGFVQRPSGQLFVPWGFNYDHDEKGRLLEAYWENEWPKVVEDFSEMKALGANTVRIHLQFGRFMLDASRPNERSLDRLDMLLTLAEEVGLYLNLTGLGCYLKEEVPGWYDAMSEQERWAAQACFWSAIALRCADHPSVFCYDLMNEPVVPGGRRDPGQWLGPAFAGKYHYVQFITLDQNGRERPEIARQWTARMVSAIREHDRRHLITVGLVPWSLDRPGLTSGFVPQIVAEPLDLLSVHIYPETGKLDESLDTLKGFAVGKPVVIEETFPLRCAATELREFLMKSRPYAAGCIGFYWGRPREAYGESASISDALTAAWLDLFAEGWPAPDAQ